MWRKGGGCTPKEGNLMGDGDNASLQRIRERKSVSSRRSRSSLKQGRIIGYASAKRGGRGGEREGGEGDAYGQKIDQGDYSKEDRWEPPSQNNKTIEQAEGSRRGLMKSGGKIPGGALTKRGVLHQHSPIKNEINLGPGEEYGKKSEDRAPDGARKKESAKEKRELGASFWSRCRQKTEARRCSER